MRYIIEGTFTAYVYANDEDEAKELFTTDDIEEIEITDTYRE